MTLEKILKNLGLIAIGAGITVGLFEVSPRLNYYKQIDTKYRVLQTQYETQKRQYNILKKLNDNLISENIVLLEDYIGE